MNPAEPTVCVYFDGGCPLCRAEIAAYQRADSAKALLWVDAHACAPDALGQGLDAPTALARLHVRRSDGTLLHGAAAFAEIWQALPQWRWLAKLTRLPWVLPVLEVGYSLFLLVRPLWRPAAGKVRGLPRQLCRELRTDHAGETGAVMIYRGILAVHREPQLRAFAQHHLAAEQRHLQLLEATVPSQWRSWLLPLWRMAGWLTGAVPALFGPRAVYATIQAVETFVDQHYGDQITLIDHLLTQHRSDDVDPRTAADTLANLHQLRNLLAECQLDETAHREDARAHWDGQTNLWFRLWVRLVGNGSLAAVRVCRYV